MNTNNVIPAKAGMTSLVLVRRVDLDRLFKQCAHFREFGFGHVERRPVPIGLVQRY
jgi:hypothetical protein